MTTELERRFLRFVSQLPGSESLDALLSGQAYAGERRADFLLFDRKVILEVKSLEVDTSYKAHAELERHRDRSDFPVFYGEVEIHKLLCHLPDGQQISDRIFDRVLRPVEAAIRSAEDQIANTARLLDLKVGAGVVALLNQDIEVLSPQVVVARVNRLLLRRGAAGALRTPIACAWLLFEGHTVEGGPSAKNLPMIALESDLVDNSPWLPELVRYLQHAWAHYNGRPLFSKVDSDFTALNIKPVESTLEGDAAQLLTRHDYWRRRYIDRPYLRTMSNDEVLRFGREASNQLMPYFLMGGPRTSEENLMPLLVKWSDFLCESEHRGLDLRGMRDV